MGVITSEYSSDILLCILLGILGFYLYFKRNSNYWKKLGVTEIPPTFFWGNTSPCIFAQKNPSQFLNEVYQTGKGESFIGFYVFDKPYLMVRDPTFIKDILVKDFNNFSNKIMCGNEKDIMGSTNLFLASNPPWKNIRVKLNPVFTSGKLKKMFDLMLEICNDMNTFFEKLNIDDKYGKAVDVKEVSAKFMTDVIGTTAFGINLNSLKDPNAEFRKYGKTMFRATYKRYFQMLSIFFIPALRPFTNAQFFDNKGTEFFRTTFWQVINERMKSGSKRSDLIDILVEIIKNQENDTAEDSFKLEGDALVAQAAAFFSGGFETSSTTTSFALYALSNNSEVQKRLRSEVLEALKKNNNKITYDMVSALPYMKMVIDETLRMFPILPWLDRIPASDYTFFNTSITLKKGVPVIMPMRAIQNDPDWFPNPQKFDPERFSEENKKNITPYTYFPFGEGPRTCIGTRLGFLQVKLALIYFISNFEFTPCKNANPIVMDKLSCFTHALGSINLNLRRLSLSEKI